MAFAINQHELAIDIYMCPLHPEPSFHLPPHSISLGCPRAPALATCFMHQTHTGHLFYIW